MPGITITINAQTAQAVTQMETFFKGMTGGLNRISGAADFLNGIGARLAQALTVGALVGFTAKAIESEEALDKLSQKTGILVESLSALRSAAKKEDLAFQDMETGLGLFSDSVFQAVRNGGQAAQVFQDMGIALLDAKSQLIPTEVLLGQVMDKFKEMPDGPEKTAAAMDLFGRGGRQWIPLLNQGAEGWKNLREQAEKAGTIVTTDQARKADEFKKSLSSLQGEAQSLFRSLANNLLPTLQEWVSWAKRAISAAKEFASGNKELSESFKSLAVVLASVAIAAGVSKGATFFVGLFGGISSLRDIAAAVSLLIGHMRALAAANAAAWISSPVALFAVALASVIQVIRAGSEAWEMFKARRDEALSVDRLKDGNLALAKSIAEVVEQRRKEGLLTEAQAAKLNKEISSALESQSQGLPNFANAELSSIASSLIPKGASTKSTADQVAAITDQEAKLQQVRMELETSLSRAINDAAEAALELSYKKRLITTEQYFQSKRDLLSSDFQAETDALSKQLDLQDQLSKSNPYNPEKLAEIKQAREKVLNQIFELAQKHKADIARIEGEQLSAQEEARKLTQQITSDYATDSQAKIAILDAEEKELKQRLSIEISDATEAQAQITRVTEVYARKRREILDKEADQTHALKIQKLQSAIDAVQENRYISEKQREEQLIQLYDREMTLIREQLAIEHKRASDSSLSSEQRIQAMQREIELQRELNNLKQQTPEDPTNLPGTRGFLRDNMNPDGTLIDKYRELDRFLKNSLQATFNGISNAITGIILKTGNWRQAMVMVWNQIVAGLVQMILEYTIFHQTRMLLDSIFFSKKNAQTVASGATAVATQTAVTAHSVGAAAAETAAWTPAALVKSIASWGLAVLIGAAALIGVMAAVGGFAEGGYVSGPGSETSDSIPAKLSRGEFVIPANRVREWGPEFFESIRVGALQARDLSSGIRSGMSRPITSSQDAGKMLPGLTGGLGGQLPSVNVEGHKVVVIQVNDDKELRRKIEENAGAIVKIVKNSKKEIGIPL